MCDCIDRMDARLVRYNRALTVTGNGDKRVAHCDSYALHNGKPSSKVLIQATFCPFCGERYAPAQTQPLR